MNNFFSKAYCEAFTKRAYKLLTKLEALTSDVVRLTSNDSKSLRVVTKFEEDN